MSVAQHWPPPGFTVRSTLLLDNSSGRFHVYSVANPPRFAVIIPACDEEACVAAVLAELRSVLDLQECVICVGVNGTSDATAGIARANGAIVAETPSRGYGHGCQGAIDALEREHVAVDAYIFFAADGANDPRDIAALIAEYRRGAAMVLGCRTQTPGNWTPMNFHYVIANRLFGLLCGLLTGRFFADLGPLRLIERRLFVALHLREWTYGWTIAAQIRAALLGATISEIPVRERQRIAGVQKVSHVAWWRTLSVGAHVIAAAFRARFAERSNLVADTSSPAVAASGRAALTGTAGAERS